jgi:hypothetical protein
MFNWKALSHVMFTRPTNSQAVTAKLSGSRQQAPRCPYMPLPRCDLPKVIHRRNLYHVAPGGHTSGVYAFTTPPPPPPGLAPVAPGPGYRKLFPSQPTPWKFVELASATHWGGGLQVWGGNFATSFLILLHNMWLMSHNITCNISSCGITNSI